jgi:hypothetical protein
VSATSPKSSSQLSSSSRSSTRSSKFRGQSRAVGSGLAPWRPAHLPGLGGHRLPLCPETSKIRYRDKTQAHEALKEIKRDRTYLLQTGQQPRRRETRVYLCPTCNGHHLTSKPQWTTNTHALNGPGAVPVTAPTPTTGTPRPRPLAPRAA